MLPRLLFTRNHGAELVAKAVRDRLGIQGCTVNDRNDVVVNHEGKYLKVSRSTMSLSPPPFSSAEIKVSGSAYKIIQHRAYHHGTMLISSSVDKLGAALKSQGVGRFGGSVNSLALTSSLGSSPKASNHTDRP